MDEAEVAKRKYINVLVGSLDTPNDTFLIDCFPLESGSNVNSSIILHIVDDILRPLETKRENFASLLTDAARYMSLAGRTLKELYPFLMHVKCVAHLLHNCAMRVRAYFKNIDKVVATIKAATIIFFFYFYFSLYIYPPDSQESDGGAIHRVSNYPDLLPEMPRYCCPLVI